MLLSKGAEQVLILEDDAVLAEGFAVEDVDAQIRKLSVRRPSWDVLQLGGMPVKLWAKKTRHARFGVAGLRLSEAVWQAHAYIIKQPALDMVRTLLEEH